VRYVYHCPVRWSDLDAFGHVNNARFLTYYEEARVALMFNAARERGLTSFAEGIVIARHEIDYLRPVEYLASNAHSAEAPSVRIEMWVQEVRNSQFTIGYEMVDGAAVASRARTVCVPFDLANQRPRRVSEAERAFLAEWAGA
jgi:acyl-CoA thioester hydrolase